MKTKKIVLVFPRFKYPSGDFSLGLAHLAGYIREKVNDISVSVLDVTFNPSFSYVESYFQKTKPDIVGIYTDIIMFKDALKVARIAKKFKINVIMGGPFVTVCPNQVINSQYVDAIFIGESEISIAEYIDVYFKNRPLKRIKGIWYKKGKEIIKNRKREPIKDLDSLPFPAFDLFDMKKYIETFYQLDSYSPNLRGISIIVSRGCPFMCTYCQPTLKNIFGSKLRIRSPKNVVQELKLLKKEYGINAFYFQDDTFTVLRKWVFEFCELLQKENMNLVWACNTRADTIDTGLLKRMRDAGLVKIKVGIETMCDRMRNDIYKKNISKEQILNLMKIAKKLKVQVSGFFMLGGPTETKKETWETIKFAANSELVEATFTIATPLPGTDLYTFVKEKGWKLSKDPDMYDYYQVRRPKMSKTEVGINELKFMKKVAYLYFYLHPKRIVNTMKSMWGIKGLKKAILKLKLF